MDWKELPVFRAKKRGLGGFTAIAAVILLVGICIGIMLQPALTQLSRARQPWGLEGVQMRSANVVAVRPDKTGAMLTLSVRIMPNGEGRIFEDIHQLKGFDFQLSHHLAVRVASRFTGVPLDDDGVGIKGVDIFFVVSAPAAEEISAIDGPSAGAAAALALIAAIDNRSLRTDAVITGTVREDGSVGVVGGLYVVKDRDGRFHVLGKPAAAHKAGMTLFLVPKGQHVDYYEPWGPFGWISRTQPLSFLRQVVSQLGWRLEIREVANIAEAAELMLK